MKEQRKLYTRNTPTQKFHQKVDMLDFKWNNLYDINAINTTNFWLLKMKLCKQISFPIFVLKGKVVSDFVSLAKYEIALCKNIFIVLDLVAFPLIDCLF